MSDVIAAPPVCGNCGQPLAAGASRCIWCGVTVPPAAVAPPAIPAPPAVASGAMPAAVPPSPLPARVTPTSEVAPSPGAAPRLVALTVDLALLAVVVVPAWLLSGSLVLAAAVLAEALLLLWILDARTGATPGKLLVRLRTALPGGAMSPGAGRSLGRGALTGAGFLLGGVGAWVVAASAAFDPWRRGWADRATDTVTLLVPDPPRAAAAPLAAPTVVDLTPAPPVVLDEPAPVLPAPAPEPALGSVVVAEPPAAALLLVFDTGQRVRLPAPLAANLGRNPAATAEGDVLVAVADPDSTVSKTHARLEHSRGATWITDGGSTNGTELVSDEGAVTPLAPGVRTLLGEGDRVRIGRRLFTVSVVVDGGAA